MIERFVLRNIFYIVPLVLIGCHGGSPVSNSISMDNELVDSALKDPRIAINLIESIDIDDPSVSLSSEDHSAFLQVMTSCCEVIRWTGNEDMYFDPQSDAWLYIKSRFQFIRDAENLIVEKGSGVSVVKFYPYLYGSLGAPITSP